MRARQGDEVYEPHLVPVRYWLNQEGVSWLVHHRHRCRLGLLEGQQTEIEPDAGHPSEGRRSRYTNEYN